MLRGEYAIYTPPIDAFGKQIAEWIDNQVSGAYFYGVPRLGKSRAVRFWLQQLMEERYGKSFPLFRWVRRHHQQVSEGEFWSELLQAVNCRYWENGKRQQKLDRLLMLLRTTAVRCRTNLIVLMIDEAQTMGPSEWRWLANLQNGLDDAGYRLTIFSIGSHELAYQHESFLLGGDSHLTARFMVQSARFRGIQSPEELAYVIRSYDEDSVWPDDSQTSYTEYFVPDAFEHGFRLAATAHVLWQVLINLSEGSKTRQGPELPMQHIARACEYVLRHGAQGESVDNLVSEAGWQAAAKQTGFASHMRMVHRFGKG